MTDLGLYYTKKAKNQGATFEKKKWHKVAVDNNNNNNRDETPIPSQFTPHFTDGRQTL